MHCSCKQHVAGHATLLEAWLCHADDAFNALKATLQPQAAFWQDHSYFDVTTPFFSYLYNLVSYQHPMMKRPSSSQLVAPTFAAVVATLKMSCHYVAPLKLSRMYTCM